MITNLLFYGVSIKETWVQLDMAKEKQTAGIGGRDNFTFRPFDRSVLVQSTCLSSSAVEKSKPRTMTLHSPVCYRLVQGSNRSSP
jgi:hypothetical protein